ncbi:MAG: CRISPR-associated protein Cas4 [Lachnospirales bacterium]
MEFKKYLKVKKKKANIFVLFSKIIYSDDKSISNVDKNLLVSEKYGVCGKPDYVIKTIFGNYIPIELKSSNIKEKDFPHENEIMQLITYFTLVNENYGKVKRGFLVYNDYMFIVKNNIHSTKLFEMILKDMRNIIETGEGECEPNFTKCKNCICRGSVCEFCKK